MVNPISEFSSSENLKSKQDAAKRHAKGFKLTGLGAFLGFISCILSILNPIPEIYYFILYGLTSISILIAFLGLYFIFE